MEIDQTIEALAIERLSRIQELETKLRNTKYLLNLALQYLNLIGGMRNLFAGELKAVAEGASKLIKKEQRTRLT